MYRIVHMNIQSHDPRNSECGTKTKALEIQIQFNIEMMWFSKNQWYGISTERGGHV